jgi:hypothetical protein
MRAWMKTALDGRTADFRQVFTNHADAIYSSFSPRDSAAAVMSTRGVKGRNGVEEKQ